MSFWVSGWKGGDVKDVRSVPTPPPPKEPEDIVEFARVVFGFEAEPKQAEVLRSTAKHGILNCTRQWGKSTVTAVKALHRAWTRAGCLVLVASPTGRQSAEWMQKAYEMARRAGWPVRGDGANAISMKLPNGSRIVGLPGTGTEGRLRGFSAVSLMLIDEAARVEDSVYHALRPMLATGDGDLWIMSTPLGQRGFFWETWEGRGQGEGEDPGVEWERVKVTAEETARISKVRLAVEKFTLPAARFRQEYCCEFNDEGTAMFDRELLEACLDDDVEPLFP